MIEKLSECIRNAVNDYAQNADSKTPAEWLQGYLGEKLPDYAIEKIHSISKEIIDTIDLMEQKQADMESAAQKGISSEAWFADDIMRQTGRNGEKARKVAEFFNGIYNSQQSYEETIDAGTQKLDETDVQWTDDEWNDYKLKSSIKDVAMEAGKSGLKEIASDVFIKALEEGISGFLSDNDFIVATLVNGAASVLKVAVSAGLAVAEETGIIPPASFKVLAATAHKTVESFKVFSEVVEGRATISEAVVKIKDTAASTFSGMWQQSKDAVKEEIVDSVSYVFGVKGAVIGGVVNGLLTPSENKSKFKTVVEEVEKSVVKFFTKEINNPFSNKNKNYNMA